MPSIDFGIRAGVCTEPHRWQQLWSSPKESDRQTNGCQREHTCESPTQPVAKSAPRSNRSRSSALPCSFRNPLQLQSNVARRLPALFRIFGETASDGVIKRRRSHRFDGANRSRLLFEDRRSHTERTLALKSALGREHFEEHRTEREQV